MIKNFSKLTLRKKKIFLTQFILLLLGLFLIVFTFIKLDEKKSNKIFSDDIKIEIDSKINKKKDTTGNVFYDIEYSGIDLSGNRYILKAKEAENDGNIDELLNLKFVTAFFYFKNDNILNISSDAGLYNNKTLDMTFEGNVIGKYTESSLLAEKAEYFNSKKLLIITENVKLNDYRGTMLAEKLVFDLEKNTLNISSTKNKKVKANLNYK